MGNCWIFVKDDSKHKEINYNDIEDIQEAKIMDGSSQEQDRKNNKNENSMSSKIINAQPMGVIRKESHPMYS